MLREKVREAARDKFQIDLEEIVDRRGLSLVLEALSFLADLKRDHVMEAWQDRKLASSWSRLARELERAATSARKEQL